MYSTPGGVKTLTASVTYVDDIAMSMAAAFREAVRRLVNEAFCDGRAASGR